MCIAREGEGEEQKGKRREGEEPRAKPKQKPADASQSKTLGKVSQLDESHELPVGTVAGEPGDTYEAT